MIVMILWISTVLVELVFLMIRLWKKQFFQREKCILNITELLFFSVLFLLQILTFGFRWEMLMLLLLLKGVVGIWAWRKRQDKKWTKLKSVLLCMGSVSLLTLAFIPALLFPPYKEIPASGNYEIKTAIYTWEDASRIESFAKDESNRKVTVVFLYTDTTETNKFPLIVFSHGAFGSRFSNRSTYQELASQGYVVCSIDHTYHAFYSKQADGTVVTINPDFFHSVFQINEKGITDDEIFQMTRGWMQLRCQDMNFVLDTIEGNVKEAKEGLFSQIDVTKIGLMGHSLGGATAVSVGRQRKDIDAVIDLDGSMLGEELACNNNQYTMNEEPYPTPLLCIDTTGHYKDGLTYGEQYVNNVILEHAIDGKEIHFDHAEHMNFTDLPLISPALAGLLGTGERNSRDCIQTMNEVILNYYNHYLKQSEEFHYQESY